MAWCLREPDTGGRDGKDGAVRPFQFNVPVWVRVLVVHCVCARAQSWNDAYTFTIKVAVLPTSRQTKLPLVINPEIQYVLSRIPKTPFISAFDCTRIHAYMCPDGLCVHTH